MPAPGGLPTTPSRDLSVRLRARLLAAGRGFVRSRSGAGAVEFALLAVPFLLLLCVVVEAAMMTLSQQTLDSAVDRAARALRTGAFQDAADGNDPASRLRRVMCGGAAVLFRCADLKLDVTRGSSFAAMSIADPYDSQRKDWAPGFGSTFQCPLGRDVVAVRAAVPVLRLFNALDFTRHPMGSNAQLLVATAIFSTEPYSGKACQ
ncbi:TadE/TadG family type IV pilus assembly protein [Methylobacterium radiodurans]|uniref:TadE family protein n=1 Tax=Methylobacterium radiodurans TaxID=2202828 RepID=A0A2U8VYH7_9HYPH|nr:TadE/TadG family type IV pilus assembly protein [Methylobacterium radiodurans]AWN38833.1 TadE family protein [Methylobacterium radiodurans]